MHGTDCRGSRLWIVGCFDQSAGLGGFEEINKIVSDPKITECGTEWELGISPESKNRSISGYLHWLKIEMVFSTNTPTSRTKCRAQKVLEKVNWYDQNFWFCRRNIAK